MPTIIDELVLTRDTYNEKGFSSITDLSTARQTEASWLTPVVTHMYYSDKTFGQKNFPMLAYTEGMGKVKTVKGFEYKFPIIGRPKRSSVVAKSLYVTGDKPGVGYSTFIIPFRDKWFYNQQTLHARGDIAVRVQGEPEYRGGIYYYTVSLYASSPSSFCPISVLAQDTVWGGGVAKAPFEDSDGVESRSYLGGTATNMTSLVRQSYKFKGNAPNSVMRYKIKAGGKTFEYYQDWEKYLADLEFQAAREYDLWYSKYTKDGTGQFTMYDKNTGVAVPSGAGLLQQISNQTTHSFLTYDKLVKMITDITFNVQDTKANIQVWTGTGGMRDIDEVLKGELGQFNIVSNEQFVQGQGYDLVFGGFFKAFRHVDGHMVTFYQHPQFDTGIDGDISGTHPKTGLPLSSHDLCILDNSVYNGESNIMYVQEEGREYSDWAVVGAKMPRGFADIKVRSSARDSSSIHAMVSQGIQIMKPTNCLRSRCIAG